MNHILWLNEIKEQQKAKVGGKAFRLAELGQAGFRIPRAFCLSTDVFDEFLAYNKLFPQINLLRLDRDKTVLKQICQRLVANILQGKISLEIREKIQENLDQLEVDRVAVRSSATAEDLYLASFAGQFESYLSLLADQVLDAVRKCWASVFSDRVLTYTLFHDVVLSQVKMAVLIQEMIVGSKGGVLFTRNTSRDESPYMLVIEASRGTAEDVVSGLVEPERIVINKKTKTEVSRTIPDGKILKPKEISQLAKLAMEVEDYFQGVPQDIEWTIKEDKIYLLQSRPVTT